MKRRDFFKKSIGASVLAGATFSLGSLEPLMAAPPALPYDLVALLGGPPDLLFDKGIAALGGMKKFVKKGQRVVIKPNIGWDKAPEFAANTNPHLVKRIVQHCFQAGAKEVLVFDHTCHEWTKCYRNSGIEEAVQSAGGKMIPAHTESYYRNVTIKGAKRLTETKVHEAMLNADVFINVPILKHHSSSKASIGMKNLMGVVWDRGYYHKNDLNQCIADFMLFKRPTLTVVDAYNAMVKNGPVGVSTSDLVNLKALIIGVDPVATDAAAIKFLDKSPHDIGHIRIAAEMGIGQIDIDKLRIKRIKV
ncbi:MAG: DUF362 domain-containing protein [Bacteroidota bacterium]|nr:DUF362 domain-containing protein [Bacteroidota bacterium]